ncbi:TetR/AcrR family transcriptional regulator [Actinoallomurus rhizosphaericola]|uniref:TetR/AcrR family transcriptional regulator n=1 Tax=Actinoallomurus rhizosphaericola TaxID=2952536 RepID=UPI002092BD65|nr:TetR/AcrR family transcriptional regulator [Actinoallomurus rhizosphaericola]MCO5996200.1 TetR/AcrR family transcriptional regulator [Actinoallomurus rhizosphaericola]
MSRWRPDARERLQRAALELFAEQGFAATTVPEITARAGLTTRTFFRHFADKREVLFAEDEFSQMAARMLADAPASMDPVTVLVEGLRTVAETRFDGRRAEVRQLRALIRSDDGLRERDLRKRAALREAVRDGFVRRGLAPMTAAVLADTGVTVLTVALDEWVDRDDERPLFEIALDALESLRAALAAGPAGATPPTGPSEPSESPGDPGEPPTA